MGWEHELAKQFKKRDNPQFKDYVIGDVISPVVEFDPETGDIESIRGELMVSCYGGQIRYTSDHLQKLSSCGILYRGQKVLLLGENNPIVLGVITDAF